jgi:hypothetical protein
LNLEATGKAPLSLYLQKSYEPSPNDDKLVKDDSQSHQDFVINLLNFCGAKSALRKNNQELSPLFNYPAVQLKRYALRGSCTLCIGNFCFFRVSYYSKNEISMMMYIVTALR